MANGQMPTFNEMDAAVCAPEITAEQMAQLLTTWAFQNNGTTVEAVMEVTNIAMRNALQIDLDDAWARGNDAALDDEE